jgi:hypothetical protein
MRIAVLAPAALENSKLSVKIQNDISSSSAESKDGIK